MKFLRSLHLWWYPPAWHEKPTLLNRLEREAYCYQAEGGEMVVITKAMYEEIKTALKTGNADIRNAAPTASARKQDAQ